MNKTIYLLLIINLLNYTLIEDYTIYYINIILIIKILILLESNNRKYMTISVLNSKLNNLLEQNYLYFNNNEEENIIQKNITNNSTNDNLIKEKNTINYHTLVVFSSARPSYNSEYRWFNNIIGSAFFTTDEIDLLIRKDENQHMISNRLQFLNYRKIVFVVIVPELESDSITRVKLNNNADIDFIMITMSAETFYAQHNIKHFIEKEVSTENIFFFFKNTSWGHLVAKLRLHRIILSGGDKSHRHVISSVGHKLSQFILILYGLSTKQIVKSYQIAKSSWDTKPNIDHTSKNAELMYKKYKKSMKNSTTSVPSNKRNFHSIALARQPHNNKVTTTDKINIDTKTYLEFLNNTINNLNYTSFEKQQQIENQWVNNEVQRLKDPIYLKTHYSNKFYFKVVESWETSNLLFQKKMNIKKFPTLWEDLNRIEYILLSLSLAFVYYNKLSWTAIAGIIGKYILYEVYLERYTEEFKQAKKENKLEGRPIKISITFPQFYESLNLGNTGFVLVGDYFLELLSRYPHNIFNSSFKDYDQRILTLNEDLIEDIKNNIIIHPSSLPMISSPSIWSDTSHGGFLSNVNQQNSVITGSIGHKHNIINREPLYQSINTLNQIQFSINTLLLDYLENEGSYLLDNIDSKDKIQMDLTLKLSKIFSSIPFYLSTKADWRGRIYTDSFFITYQGNDLSSSLLNFWEGESLTKKGLEYLYIYGANNHNENIISKDSFNARIQWVKNNYNKIISLDKDLILSAENKFIFTAFCLNMRELHKDPKFIIKTPVFLDATCSGIQHLAALLRDLELGTNVNLVPNLPEDKPNDIYSLLIDPINSAINQFGVDNPEFKHFTLIKFNRNILKSPIMTKVYNVSTYGIANQLKSKFKQKTEDQIANQIKNNLKNHYKIYYIAPGIKDEIILNPLDIYKIANIINDKIFIVFPSLNNIYSYFLNMAKIMIKLNIPITWFTPNGMEITQHYLKSKETKVAIRIFGRTKKIVMKEFTGILDSKKQEQAIIPNIIHSLDANHLINIINSARLENFSPIISVHDCFGTLPNKMPHLEYRVRKEFILLYSQDNFLSLFHKTLINSIKNNNIKLYPENENDNNKLTKVFIKDKWINIPKVPQLGKLDLQKIINSKYIIS